MKLFESTFTKIVLRIAMWMCYVRSAQLCYDAPNAKRTLEIKKVCCCHESPIYSYNNMRYKRMNMEMKRGGHAFLRIEIIKYAIANEIFIKWYRMPIDEKEKHIGNTYIYW